MFKLSKQIALLVGACVLTSLTWAQQKPAEIKIGITTFLSGPASVFGMPAKAAAEVVIDDMNAKGGIGGVKISASFIDEGLGADPLLSEYRRLVQDQGVRTMLSAISSGNCNGNDYFINGYSCIFSFNSTNSSSCCGNSGFDSGSCFD